MTLVEHIDELIRQLDYGCLTGLGEQDIIDILNLVKEAPDKLQGADRKQITEYFKPTN